jgi:serine/threonine protein kinase/WD40 repeat protein
VSTPPNPEVAILSAALELRAEDRAAYLDKVCVGDTALRGRVEGLLEAHEQAGEFLETPPTGLGSAKTLRPGIPLAEKPGDKIGHYKLLQQIGEGGCGVVYMAEQEEPVRRRVALKVIKLGMDTKSVIARFEAERQVLAMMDHPNIARVFDAGATDTGRPFFVMELVRGIKITEFCDQNKLSTQERLNLFIQVCQAIQHAHQKGIIHRDIKPSNILVTVNEPGSPGVPKVIDFGIAKATQGRLTNQTLFTAFEQFLGTPAYMSPEQAVMTTLDIDTRSDIYSLGVLLYELLTGKTPFEQKELLAAGLDEMRRTIRETDPPKPSTRLSTMAGAELSTTAGHRQTEAPRLIHTVRGDLDWIVMKCLAKDRSKRYETANGVARDIERHLHHEPVIARPPSRLYELRKTVRRHWVGFAATAAVIAALVLALIVSTVAASRIQRDNRQIRSAKDDATEKLRQSYLEQARALRISRLPGQRFAGLNAVSNAAAIRKDIAVRNEATACLALSDLRVARQANFKQPSPSDYVFAVPDFNLERYAVFPEGDTSGNLTVRAVSDDKLLPVLSVPGSRVAWIKKFSLNSRYLLVLYQNSQDGKCSDWVWDLESNEAVLRALPSGQLNDWAMIAGDFSSDSRLLARCQPDETLCIYELSSGRVLKQFPGGRLFSSCKLNSGNSRLACSAGEDPNVEIFDVESGRVVRTLNYPSRVTTTAWSPDGRHLATACYDFRIHLWNVETGKQEMEFAGHTAEVLAVAFNHTGNLLTSGSWDGLVRLWDVESGRELANYPGSPSQLQFSPDDRQVLGWWDRIPGGSVSGSLEVAHSRECRLLRAEQDLGVGGLEFSSDGRILAARYYHNARFWDVYSSKGIGSLLLPDCDTCDTLIFHPDGGRLILTDQQGGVSVRALERSKDSTSFAYRLGPPQWLYQAQGITSSVLSRDGRYLAVTHESEDESLVFDLNKPLGKPVVLRPHASVDRIAISPDGRWVATGSWHNPLVKVWDTRSPGAAVKTWPMSGRTLVTFSPDGRWLATSSTEYQLWEVGSWQPRGPAVPAHPDPNFNYITFSPDGKVMARKMEGRKIELLETSTAKALATLEAPDLMKLGCFSFSPNGTQLAAVRADQQVQLWDLRLIRQELSQMGLDWDMPPYPPVTNPETEKPSTLEIESNDPGTKNQ